MDNPREIEQKLTAKKEWTMMGEVKASNRPVNSLVSSQVEFATHIVNVPITKEENAEIFKYVVQRFREKTFDNYEFKEIKPKIKEEIYDVTPVESNKELVELYEKIEKEIRRMTDYGM